MARKRTVAPSDYTQTEAPTPLERGTLLEPAAAPQLPAARPAAEAQPQKPRPVHEIRISRVKACIWANQTEAGVRHNVTLSRIFKEEGQWQESRSLGRDEIPVGMEVLRRAWLWILEHGPQQQ
jgi:hypothetical protein